MIAKDKKNKKNLRIKNKQRKIYYLLEGILNYHTNKE